MTGIFFNFFFSPFLLLYSPFISFYKFRYTFSICIDRRILQGNPRPQEVWQFVWRQRCEPAFEEWQHLHWRPQVSSSMSSSQSTPIPSNTMPFPFLSNLCVSRSLVPSKSSRRPFSRSTLPLESIRSTSPSRIRYISITLLSILRIMRRSFA